MMSRMPVAWNNGARHRENMDISSPKNSKLRPDAIANWLFLVAFLVFAMVVVGGITRLTESGLSITEWKPVSGALPPLSHADWMSEFQKYQATPEYQQINNGMTLSQFKFIYFWEWAHRLLGRLIGLAFALPFIWFLVKGAVPANFRLRLVTLFILGGLQGAIGWWMVVSGLSERTDVSHFRLATHLLMALFIMACLIWTALDLKLLARDGAASKARVTSFALMTGGIIFVQLLFGAYVAGLNAGYVSNSWPLMDGRLFPAGIIWDQGFIHAILNDPFLIHFIHRWWAWAVVAILVILARRVRKNARRVSVAIHTAFGVQILLGIATVMTGINLAVAALHQAVGAIVVASAIWGAHHLGRK